MATESPAATSTDKNESGGRCAGQAGRAFEPDVHSQRTAPDHVNGTEYDCDVSIGLLCYRDRQRIDDLLASIQASPRRYKYEWLLSDNGSTDGTRAMVREKYPYVRILENGANLGVAGGRNRLFWNSRAKYTMILDSDTLVQPDTVDILVDTAEQHPQAGLIHPRLEYQDGSLQLSIRPFPRFRYILCEGTKFRRFFEWTGIPARADMRNVSHDRLMQVECFYGAAMLVRNRLTREVGGFDEGYFYQYEDYDLCFRYQAAGYENWYQPQAVVTHFYAREDVLFHQRLNVHIRSILRFQMRNMWRMSRAPVVHRRDLDGQKVPEGVGVEPLSTSS